MATIKIALDKRASNTTKDNKHMLVLRLGHRSKTRDIPFNIHLKEDQFDQDTGKIIGIMNAVRQTKRTRKIYSDVDFWLDENEGEIRNWEISRLKSEIERLFFKKQLSRTILEYGMVYLNRMRVEERFSTVDSYEDALKVFVKYQKFLKRKDDKEKIKALYRVTEDGGMELLEEFRAYDMQILAFDYSYARDFKAYMNNRFPSRNTTNIYLRSIQAILNDAGASFPDLKDHKPLTGIKKRSFENAPLPFTLKEVNNIREIRPEPHTGLWHTRNFFLFMFNNMGMNFMDMGLLKRGQFRDGSLHYIRKKTRNEGDHFSLAQTDEALEIIRCYLNGQKDHEYLFPIIPNRTKPERIHKINADRIGLFNKHAKKLAGMAGINKKFTTYTARDTWTNIGLSNGVDLRTISAGLGHSSVQVTERHYGKLVEADVLNKVNAKITRR